MRVCTEAGCTRWTDLPAGKCAEHLAEKRRRHDRIRESTTERGYGTAWRRRRARYLRAHPTCSLCPAPATVPDHWPISRRELVAQGVADPDADQHLRPLCTHCHNRETGRRMA
jgi:5-methylcytosine-specific restriction protein A